MSLIQPRVLSGFRDYLPETMMPREALIDTAKRVYRSFGFCPIDTPSLEYEEILTGKGGTETDKQLYRFEDNGGRAVCMRFDLTVPLARFVAQHISSLGTPFKRYHIATVWRGERAQRGRYREFMQCDFDTIGSTSISSDIETGLVIFELLKAIGFDDFKIHMNNRMILNGVLEKLDVLDRSVPILRSLDKLAKIGPEKVASEMETSAEISSEQAKRVLEFASLSGSNREVLERLQPIVAGNELGEQGVESTRRVLEGLEAAGVPDASINLDVSIARGLDYYTGVIFETFLGALPQIGSVCSGGRYDNLAGLYTKQHLPGIGASLGLDRLLAAMEELDMLPKTRTPAPVFIVQFDKDALNTYLQIASWIRQSGIGTVLYPDAKKIGAQLKYADQRGFQVAVIAGEQELSRNSCQVKDLASQTSKEVSLENNGAALITEIQQMLNTADG